MARMVKKVQKFMYNNNIDAMLINSKTMKKWLSTMTGSGCNILITQNKGFLILDERYLTEAKEKEHDLEILLNSSYKGSKNYLAVVEDILKKENCHNLGIEASQMLVKDYRDVEKLGVQIILLDKEIAKLRIIKTQEEIDTMKEAIDITDDIYKKVIENIRVGMTEYEISALIQYNSIASGAQQMSFDTIVATGERTALPHGRPTQRKVKAHEPIMIDFGIQYKNYQSDMTRMCFIGEPDPKIKEIYDIVLKAQLAGLNAIKSGVVASSVDKAARDIISKAGYSKYFNHGLGHGLGIGDGCEMPVLNPESNTILKEHMMMSCEPGIYVPNVGGVRIEDDVVIINGKGIPLNKTTKDYIILEVR
ncbi:aminopeptidase P family protein [Clostridium sp. cel8]|uniref:M24 family metallopeptidase n=1 Tax=unclassified Clostridium TaxID=2614128 RepID=UPI0015F36A0E|nr:Xaa-Pro peptidase family protein [Clostridium sp. cel8]MBA5851194.1 aminopeptidase P family protein [Clostridium sp. cel8]